MIIKQAIRYAIYVMYIFIGIHDWYFFFFLFPIGIGITLWANSEKYDRQGNAHNDTEKTFYGQYSVLKPLNSEGIEV